MMVVLSLMYTFGETLIIMLTDSVCGNFFGNDISIHFGCFEHGPNIHSTVWDGYQDGRDCNGQIPFEIS